MKLPRFTCGVAFCAIIALALGLRAGGCLWWQGRVAQGERFEFGDSEAYWVLGSHIAHAEAYQYGSSDVRIFRMPGYPLLLAAMLSLFGDEMPVLYARLLSAALGTAAVGANYWLAATLIDRRTGLLAALATACYPGAIAMSVVVLSEAPFCPFYLAQLAAWSKSWQAASADLSMSFNWRAATWALVSGLLGGLATLMRPDWLLFTPFVAVVGLMFTRHRVRHLALALLMSAAIVAVMAPWWWRNFLQYGTFVPTTLQTGASLYDGLNPKATGASDMSFVAEFVRQERQNPAPNAPLELRLDRRMFEAALRWSREHPARVIELAAIKFVRMWNVWPNDPQHRGGAVRFLTAATFLPAIGLALVGVWRTRRPAWPTALAWLPAVYLTLPHLIFVSSIRYREPPMLALLVFAAAALTGGVRSSSAR